MATSRAVREVLRQEGKLSGLEVTFTAVTPSGQTVSLSIAQGDQIRFLIRNDRLGVVNGTVAKVLGFERRSGRDSGSDLEVKVEIGNRRVQFSLDEIADERGRARIGWAYASTVYQSQGMTVENAIVLVDHRYDRHQIYVAASRAREQTTLVVNSKVIDRHLSGEMPVGQQQREVTFSPEARRAWLAERLSRANVKESALQVLSDAGGRTRDGRGRTWDRELPAQAGSESTKRMTSREASLD